MAIISLIMAIIEKKGLIFYFFLENCFELLHIYYIFADYKINIVKPNTIPRHEENDD